MIGAGYDAVGVDPMAPAGADYRQLEFERLDLRRKVDAVVACTSLHHVQDLDDVLSRVAWTLRDGGILVVVEWDWEGFDEATARWCFDRLDPAEAGAGPSWVKHLRDAWVDSGDPWDVYLRAWATHEGLHTVESMLRALDTRFDRQSVTRGPYFFSHLAHTTESDEQAAIDAGLIQPAGLRYVARLPRLKGHSVGADRSA
jgi:SAM-dependent methyltransferase